jgi:hypothetical protein
VQQSGLGQEGYLLFSCSADRTIRVWDPAVRDLSKACVQTLQGHGGTVTSLAYCEGILVSSSTDNTIRAWKVDEGRDLLLYPWFSPHLTLSDIGCWVNALALQVRRAPRCARALAPRAGDRPSCPRVRRPAPRTDRAQMGEGSALFVGDEHGALSVYRVLAGPTRSSGFALQRWRRHPHAHSLGITRLLLVAQASTRQQRRAARSAHRRTCPRPLRGAVWPTPRARARPSQEHVVVSASYDRTVRVFDTMSGSVLFSIENGRKCMFSSMHWDRAHAELLLGDELGCARTPRPHSPPALLAHTCLHSRSSRQVRALLEHRGGALPQVRAAAEEAAARRRRRRGQGGQDQRALPRGQRAARQQLRDRRRVARAPRRQVLAPRCPEPSPPLAVCLQTSLRLREVPSRVLVISAPSLAGTRRRAATRAR